MSSLPEFIFRLIRNSVFGEFFTPVGRCSARRTPSPSRCETSPLIRHRSVTISIVRQLDSPDHQHRCASAAADHSRRTRQSCVVAVGPEFQPESTGEAILPAATLQATSSALRAGLLPFSTRVWSPFPKRRCGSVAGYAANSNVAMPVSIGCGRRAAGRYRRQ